MLTGVRMTVDVGYVELVKGRMLTDEEVTRLIAAGGGPRRTPRTPPPPPPLPPRAEIEAALDAALTALAGPPAAGMAPGAGAADPEGGAPWIG